MGSAHIVIPVLSASVRQYLNVTLTMHQNVPWKCGIHEDAN